MKKKLEKTQEGIGSQPSQSTARTKSKSFRLAFWSFIFSMVITVLGTIEEMILFGHTFKFRAVDAMVIFAFLTPCLGLYGLRRFTDKIK